MKPLSFDKMATIEGGYHCQSAIALLIFAQRRGLLFLAILAGILVAVLCGPPGGGDDSTAP